MTTRMLVMIMLIITINASLCCASDACVLGYLDPGSGAMIFQMIIASVVGAGVALKLFWGNIKAFFSSSKTEDQVEGLDKISEGDKE